MNAESHMLHLFARLRLQNPSKVIRINLCRAWDLTQIIQNNDMVCYISIFIMNIIRIQVHIPLPLPVGFPPPGPLPLGPLPPPLPLRAAPPRAAHPRAAPPQGRSPQGRSPQGRSPLPPGPFSSCLKILHN